MSDADPTTPLTDQTSAQDYVLEDQVGYILRVVSQRHAAIFQERSPEGLTPRQFSVLVRVAEMGACSQNHLGRLTAMDVATIKGVVDRLKGKGLLVLSPDTSDKRRTIIQLTPKAQAMIAGLHDIGHRITRETLEPLSPSEQATLVRLLLKMT